MLLFADADGRPTNETPSSYTQPTYYIQIPRSITALKQQDIRLAQAWQIGLRNALLPALEQGYAAISFVEQDGKCWYVLGHMSE